MESTVDLNTLMEQDEFTGESLHALKELAFSNHESFDRFRELLARCADSPGASSSQALKIGVCYQLLGDHERADTWLQKAAPGADRSFCLAQDYREHGQFDNALAELERSAEQGRDRLECDLQRAETLVVAGRGDEAQEILNQHAKAGESSGQWHYVSGRLEQALGRTEEAARRYERALELDEENPFALFHLAYLASLHGDDDEARQLYQDCASLPYVYANALINLSVIYEDDGDFEEAARCLRRVLAARPDHPRASLYLKDVVSATEMYYDEQKVHDQQQYDAVMDIPVTDFELSVRARNCLKRMNIFTLGDLLRISERELLAYKNFGDTSLNEIKAMLSQKGLALGQFAGEAAADMTVAAPPPTGDPEMLAKPVSGIELSVRARKCLQRLGIGTLGELMATTEAELLGSKNFGQTSLSEIKQRLDDLGLSLRTSR